MLSKLSTCTSTPTGTAGPEIERGGAGSKEGGRKGNSLGVKGVGLQTGRSGLGLVSV